MSDRLFYPFAFLLITCMVLGAIFGDRILNGAPELIDPVSDGFVLEGDGLRELVASPGTTVRYAGNAENPTAYAILSAHQSREEATPSAGVFGFLGPIYEQAFGGRKVRVTARVRSGQENPSDIFTLAYHTAQVGDSPRTPYTLTPDFQDYVLEYNVKPPRDGGNKVDYAGMWPDLEGLNRSVELERLSVFVID